MSDSTKKIPDDPAFERFKFPTFAETQIAVRNEIAQLRADLARVTAERDAAKKCVTCDGSKRLLMMCGYDTNGNEIEDFDTCPACEGTGQDR
jgi:hypothetical protein